VHYWTGLLSEDHIHLSMTKQSADYIYVCNVKPHDILKVTNSSGYTICILLDDSTLEYQQLYYLWLIC